MFLPLHDDAPLRVIRFQYMCGVIAALNVVALLLTEYLAGGGDQAVYFSYGAIPAALMGRAELDPALVAIPEAATLVTYMFLHGGWLHLISNMFFLWVFADNVEDAYGHLGFVAFYLFCGVAAAGAHVAFLPDSDMPLVGASGAVAGVLGAYLVLFPKSRVWILLFMRLPIRISATWALVGWIGFQFVAAAIPQQDVTVAWWAHIGGFAAGFTVTWLVRARLRERLFA